MNNEEYVLIGKWEEDMEKKNSIPTLFEIRKYFSPGKMIMVPYFRDGSSNSHGRAIVGGGGHYFQRNSINRFVKRVVEHNPGSRLVVVESDEDLEKVIESVREKGLVPILMERLR